MPDGNQEDILKIKYHVKGQTWFGSHISEMEHCEHQKNKDEVVNNESSDTQIKLKEKIGREKGKTGGKKTPKQPLPLIGYC